MDLGITEYAPYDYKNHIETTRFRPLQNQYGLFRTANVDKVSTPGVKIGGREYFWIMNVTTGVKEQIYDRTYYNTKGDSLGYFFYVDAGTLGENGIGW